MMGERDGDRRASSRAAKRLRRIVAGTGIGIALAAASASSAAATPAIVSWGTVVGNGAANPPNALTPVPVGGLINARSVAAGDGFELALLENGTVFSWSTRETKPTQVGALAGVTAISAGEGTLALLGDGVVKALGEQPLEAEPGEEKITVPRAVPGITDAIAVSQGAIDPELTPSVDDGQHNLALRADGTVLAWGDNAHGQLGNGTTAYGGTPAEVPGLGHVVAVSAGGGDSLALLEDGHVMAWGENNAGQLGDGKSGKKFNSLVPVEVLGLSGVVAVAAGGEDSLALLEDGTVVAWGSNHRGELGRSPLELAESAVPLPIPGLAGVTAIAAGARNASLETDHNLAVLSSGHAVAWGAGAQGQLGDGSSEDSSEPVEVAPLVDVTSIAAAQGESVAAGPPAPVVTSIEPTIGPIAGGTAVTVRGFNLEDATSVMFGSREASHIEADDPEALIAVTPPSSPQSVAVTVTTPFGTSGKRFAQEFRFTPPGVLEVGRCAKVAKGTGSFSSNSCVVAAPNSKDAWEPGLVKSGFSFSSKGLTLETPAGKVLACTGNSGGGEYLAPDALADVQLVFTGCAASKNRNAAKCSTAGAAEGEVVASPLQGELGFSRLEGNNVALALRPLEEGTALLSFSCGATSIEVRGPAFAAVTKGVDKMSTTTALNYAGAFGKPRITGFEGGASEPLEASVAGAPFQKANVFGKLNLINEEALEINTVV